ncbi:MAG: hypothetical protein COB30_009255 [Ectothiorhodospiraceae bacterium]|nr:hypothetical protein [Ectothiorhodospiraceae bacterium]
MLELYSDVIFWFCFLILFSYRKVNIIAGRVFCLISLSVLSVMFVLDEITELINGYY